MAKWLVRTGLFLAVAAVLGLIVTDTEMGGVHETFLGHTLMAGGGLIAAGLVVMLLSKVASVRFGRRCPTCGHRVQRGHIYCEDHFQESLNRARDLLRNR